jgi:hypothetical protein
LETAEVSTQKLYCLKEKSMKRDPLNSLKGVFACLNALKNQL